MIWNSVSYPKILKALTQDILIETILILPRQVRIYGYIPYCLIRNKRFQRGVRWPLDYHTSQGIWLSLGQSFCHLHHLKPLLKCTSQSPLQISWTRHCRKRQWSLSCLGCFQICLTTELNTQIYWGQWKRICKPRTSENKPEVQGLSQQSFLFEYSGWACANMVAWRTTHPGSRTSILQGILMHVSTACQRWHYFTWECTRMASTHCPAWGPQWLATDTTRTEYGTLETPLAFPGAVGLSFSSIIKLEFCRFSSSCLASIAQLLRSPGLTL